MIDCFIYLFLFSNFTYRAKGCELVAVDLERDIAEQGPFDMLLYKVRIPPPCRGKDDRAIINHHSTLVAWCHVVPYVAFLLPSQVTDELVRGDDEKQQRKIANLEVLHLALLTPRTH